jgi:hypothetical protein
MSAVAYPLAKHGAEAFARMLPFDKLRAGLYLSVTPFFLSFVLQNPRDLITQSDTNL